LTLLSVCADIKTEETVWDVPAGIVVEQQLSPFRGVTKTLADPGGAPVWVYVCRRERERESERGLLWFRGVSIKRLL